MNKQWQMSRRTALKGMGAVVGLPLLEAMLPATGLGAAGAASAPLRMAFLYVPNGKHMADWTPSTVGALGKLPATLQPLAPFQQIDSGYARTQQGTGLGLALVRNFVRLMGGDISLRSALGEGSTFTVRLPIRPKPMTSVVANGKRILKSAKIFSNFGTMKVHMKAKMR